MWQEEQAASLHDEIDALLDPLREVPGLHELLREALAGAKPRPAGLVSGPPWALLPLIVCEGISGHFDAAVPAAAAIHLFKTAAEVFDDLEDADSSLSLAALHGAAAATNAATALLILAEKAIGRLHHSGVPDSTIVRIVDVANTHYTAACAGQHLDLTSEVDLLSEESYLRMVAMKSASHLECACRVGAMVASAGDPEVQTYGDFGRNLGVAVQITNDLQGVESGTDIAKRKVTLPVIYALSNMHRDEVSLLSAWYRNHQPELDFDNVRRILVQRGATYYCRVKAEMFKQSALAALGKANLGEPGFGRLKMFLERSRNT